MPDLPMNVQYKSLRGAIAPMIQTAQDVGRMLPRPQKTKKVDVSGYRGLMDQMGNYRTAQSTPAAIKGLGTITTPYGGSTRYESFHPGIDVAGKEGTPISAFTSGMVSEVRTAPGSPYGNYVIVTDQQGNQHRYSHLSNSWVGVGEKVGKGTILGSMGRTGNVYSPTGLGTGVHLDYRIKNLYNQYVNPYAYISS